MGGGGMRIIHPELRERVAGWVRRAFTIGGTGTMGWRTVTGGSESGAALSDAYAQSVWVHSCVRMLGENIANIPWRISLDVRGGDDLIEAGPVVELFERPNPFMSHYDFWELLLAWMALRGRAYVVATDRQNNIVRLRGRMRKDPALARLWILDADRVQRMPAVGGQMVWRYAADMDIPIAAQVLLPEELLLLRFPAPSAPIDGMAPLKVAQLAAQTDYAAAQVMKGLMVNNADTGLVVTAQQPLTEEQREQVLAALRERKRQAGTADRPLVMGGVSVEKPLLSMVDMQFLENRRMSRQEICAVFGVPQELLGISEDANRSVSEAVRLSFIDYRIEPLCYRIEAVMQVVCDAFDESLVGWFDVDSLPIRAAARRSRIDAAVKLWGMGYPANEINQALDLGLPAIAGGDVGYLPFSVQPATGPGSAVEGGNDFPGAPEGEADVPPADGADAPSAGAHGHGREVRRRGGRRGLPPAANPFRAAADLVGRLRGAVLDTEQVHICGPASPAYLASIRGSVRVKRGKLQRLLFEQRKSVLAALAKNTGTSAAPGAATRALADDVFDVEKESRRLLKLMTPLLIADLQFGGAQLFADVGIGTDFTLPPEAAMRHLQLRQNALKGVTDTTYDAIKAGLDAGLAEGETMEQLADRVREAFGGSQLRSETIALTETNSAVNSGRMEGIKESGLELKAWLASNLENSRATHQRAGLDYADGIPTDEAFLVGGESLMHPGDPSGSPGNTINCKCTVVAVSKGGKGLADPGSGAGLFGLTFEAWAETGLQATAHGAGHGVVGGESPDAPEDGFRKNAQGSENGGDDD